MTEENTPITPSTGEAPVSPRFLGYGVFLYSILGLILVTYETIHGLSFASTAWIFVPLLGVLLGFKLMSGDDVDARRAALYFNGAWVLCVLVILYQCIVYPWDLVKALSVYRPLQSILFYGANAVILWLFQRAARFSYLKSSFLKTSPWRGGIVALLVGSVFFLHEAVEVWKPEPWEVLVPVRNLLHYLQGAQTQFLITRVTVQHHEKTYGVVVKGYGFSNTKAYPMELSWIILTRDAFLALQQGALKEKEGDGELALGVAFLSGLGRNSDLKEAVNWFARSAARGNPQGKEAYAIALMNGSGVLENVPEAYDLLWQAAQQHNAEAQWLLSKIQQ